MNKNFLLVFLLLSLNQVVFATPSTQIWIPSTDIQNNKQIHLGIDNYFRSSDKSKSPPNASATRDANIYDIGPLFGISFGEKLKGEIGFDYLVNANNPNDKHPWSGNFKLGTMEGSLFTDSPAIAIGMYNIGSSQPVGVAPGVTSGQNIAYALLAKSFYIGRFSAGYYQGSKRALVDTNGNKSNDGALLSWDRTMKEINDKLWLAIDYQSGHNVDGALNFGTAWNFASNVSVIFGYDIYTEKKLAGTNTFTTQLDINFP